MPVFTNSQQVTLVLQSLLLGVGIGAVYDMLRALRLHFRCGWAGAALFDTMFWAIVLAALFEFGLIAAAGQPRGFVLLTAAGGMGIVLCGAERNCAGGDYAAPAGACKAETRRIRPADALSNGGKTAVQSGKNSVFDEKI